VSAFDPWTMGGAAGRFLLIAVAAAIVPARRAARVDPVVALRAE
jgi:ABC-type lipoprotein release transport system permease subunit